MEVSRVCPSHPVAQSSFIIHRAKQTINSAAMYEGWRDATSCEWWGAKNQRPHSFLALMAITSPDSTSKTRLIIRSDPFKEDWLALMPRQITHKYLPRIKQLRVLRYRALIFDGRRRIGVSTVADQRRGGRANRKKLIMQWRRRRLVGQQIGFLWEMIDLEILALLNRRRPWESESRSPPLTEGGRSSN